LVGIIHSQTLAAGSRGPGESVEAEFVPTAGIRAGELEQSGPVVREDAHGIPDGPGDATAFRMKAACPDALMAASPHGFKVPLPSAEGSPATDMAWTAVVDLPALGKPLEFETGGV
jgi:hypothetical protein